MKILTRILIAVIVVSFAVTTAFAREERRDRNLLTLAKEAPLKYRRVLEIFRF
jgi:hypothetical protein